MIKNTRPSSIPRDGLVGEWLLDGNATDTSGNGNDGTASNVSWVDSEVGFQKEIGSFNGTSSYVSLGNDLFTQAELSDFTIHVEFNTSSLALSQRPFDIESIISIIVNDDGSTTCRLYNGSAYDTITTSVGLISTGTNHVLSYTRDSSKAIVYLDNVNVGEISSPSEASLDAFSREWRIGSYFSGGGNYMNGTLGLARIYNRALSEPEINSLYLEGKRKLGQYNHSDLMQGLVGYLDMRGDASDVSGNGNDGVVSGATLTTDHLGNANSAYSFNGISDWIDTSDADFDASGDFNVFGWVKFDTFLSTTDTRWVGKRVAGADGWMILAGTDGKLRVDFYGNSGTYYTNSSPTATFSTGVYYHVGFTYNNTTKLLQCYIDGVADGSVTTAGTPTLNNVNLEIGRVSTSYFEGDVSSFMYQDKALSADEVKALYNLTSEQYIYPWSKTSLPNLEEGKVLHLNGNNNGTTFYDQSGNGNNGTQSGGVTTSRVGQHEVMKFDGVDDYIDNITGITYGNANTIMMRIKTNQTTKAHIFSETVGGTYPLTALELNAVTTDGKIRWFIGKDVSNRSRYETTSGGFATGDWVHIALVNDGNSMTIYNNGVSVPITLSIDDGTFTGFTGTELNIGNRPTQEFFDGEIDSFEIINRALSATEVQQDFHTQYIN